MDNITVQDLINKGYVAVVYVAYAYADKQCGDIISKHKSYEAANRKARGSSMWGVRFLDEYQS
jgi:hypothetical protein